MRRSKLNTFLFALLTVALLPLSLRAQAPSSPVRAGVEVEIDLEVKADLEVLARERAKPSAALPSGAKPAPSVEMVADSIVVVDEERLFQDLSQQWVIAQRDLRDFRAAHRPACEQNTDLKANEWHFLRRVSDYISFQAQRVRETYAVANDPTVFAETKFQSMITGQEEFKLLKSDRSDSNQMRTDVTTAAVNLLLSEMALRAEVETIKSGGVWQIGPVSVPHRIVLSFVQGQMVVFAWYKWAKWLQSLPTVKRVLKASNRSLLVKLSPKTLPPVCRSPSTMNACVQALRLTRRGAYTLARGSQVLVFQSGAILGGLALWSDVWNHAIELSSWHYLRIPRWREKVGAAVRDYNKEIQDLCFFRQCYESRMVRRVGEGQERSSVANAFLDPNDPHSHLKSYCETFNGGKK